MRLATCELRMNLPRALAGFTPIICSVRIADEPVDEPVLGVGGGEPCRCGGGTEARRIAAASAGGGLGVAAGRATAAAAGAPAGAVARRRGSFAICRSRALPPCGRG